jgi:DNA-binding response OmpR family regulator
VSRTPTIRAPAKDPDSVEFLGTRFNLRTGELTGALGSSVVIEGRERRVLLFLFLKNPGVKYSTEHLLSVLYGEQNTRDKGIIKVYVSQIRAQLRKVTNALEIDSVRNKGYFLN